MLTADDRFAILDIIGRYNNRCDAFDLDEALATLTTDVEMAIYVNDSSEPLASICGPELLRSVLEPRHKQSQAMGVRVRHLLCNTQFVCDDENEVEILAQVMVLYQRVAERPRLVQSGDYQYRVRRTDSGWRICAMEARSSGVYNPLEVFDQSDETAKV